MCYKFVYRIICLFHVKMSLEINRIVFWNITHLKACYIPNNIHINITSSLSSLVYMHLAVQCNSLHNICEHVITESLKLLMSCSEYQMRNSLIKKNCQQNYVRVLVVIVRERFVSYQGHN